MSQVMPGFWVCREWLNADALPEVAGCLKQSMPVWCLSQLAGVSLRQPPPFSLSVRTGLACADGVGPEISLRRQAGAGPARLFSLFDLRKGRRVKKLDRPGQTRMVRAANEKPVAIG
jgi:hypothetical protein